MEGRNGSFKKPTDGFSWDWRAELSRQITQTAQPDLFADRERLSVTGSDRPAPITGAIAQIVEERGGNRWPAFDELRTVAFQRLHLRLDERSDVENERRSNVQAEMDA